MTASRSQSDTHAIARAHVAAGLSVVPIRRDGSKAPTVKWKAYQQRRPTDAELRHWFGCPKPPGIAVVGGRVSGELELLDFDQRADVIFPAWCELVEAERPGLVARLNVVKTPRPGYHIRYCCPDLPGGVPGNEKLAEDPSLPAKRRVLIETRGPRRQRSPPTCCGWPPRAAAWAGPSPWRRCDTLASRTGHSTYGRPEGPMMRGIDRRLRSLEGRLRRAPAAAGPAAPDPAQFEKEFAEVWAGLQAGISDEEARARGWNARNWPESSALRAFAEDVVAAGLAEPDGTVVSGAAE